MGMHKGNFGAKISCLFCELGVVMQKMVKASFVSASLNGQVEEPREEAEAARARAREGDELGRRSGEAAPARPPARARAGLFARPRVTAGA